MLIRMSGVVALLGLVLLLAEVALSADDKKREVPLPKLPEGAGKMDEDAPKTFTETKSGLKYRVLRKGMGAMPKAENTVEAHYHGWLDDGKVFDSSYKRGKPTEFPLDGVIKGWTEGLQLIGKGGMIELDIPGKLAYPRGRPGIPPNAPLHFLVELVDVK